MLQRAPRALYIYIYISPTGVVLLLLVLLLCNSHLSRQEKAQPEAKAEHQRASEVGVILLAEERKRRGEVW